MLMFSLKGLCLLIPIFNYKGKIYDSELSSNTFSKAAPVKNIFSVSTIATIQHQIASAYSIYNGCVAKTG